ncbi:acetate kinase [Hahella sp. CCB-MM4]|uniref:acetate/propionate family kinase n=1 Tax=Hahella sp. (strain CCB-MM4) TaxID=1926491 RepID=UPI000B9AB470|nr:acetate kinase [Hahella sp. CCB-MM4]OZG73835.1 acetate kinase [Hahella sp. CCB-MM4]
MTVKDRILVLNSGSSSLKFAIMDPESEPPILSGLAENLGKPDAVIKFTWQGDHGKTVISIPGATHQTAIRQVLDLIAGDEAGTEQITGVGHRVVHGGEAFTSSVRIDGSVIAKIEACNPLAPLHNPANVQGIRAIAEQLPNIPQVAVFDTAFHQTLPESAFLYALPYDLYREHGLRRYGFHGTSHRYVAAQAAERLNQKPDDLNLVTVHLGNGCSATAIQAGRSVDTTMGMTPLEGLVMGTRSGDVDPGLLLHLSSSLGYDNEQLSHMLNKQSGLLGLSGISNDMRTLMDQASSGNERAKLAIEVFCYRLAKAISGLWVAANPVHGVIFTGGIGENAAPIRSRVCSQLNYLGIRIENKNNDLNGRNTDGVISTEDSVPVLVIPTNEELMIARDTLDIISQNK